MSSCTNKIKPIPFIGFGFYRIVFIPQIFNLSKTKLVQCIAQSNPSQWLTKSYGTVFQDWDCNLITINDIIRRLMQSKKKHSGSLTVFRGNDASNVEKEQETVSHKLQFVRCVRRYQIIRIVIIIEIGGLNRVTIFWQHHCQNPLIHIDQRVWWFKQHLQRFLSKLDMGSSVWLRYSPWASLL